MLLPEAAKVAFALPQSTRCQSVVVALADAFTAVAEMARVALRAAVSISDFMIVPSRVGEAVASKKEGNLSMQTDQRRDDGHRG